MTDLQNQLVKKDAIIEQLKQMLEVTKQRERERDAPNGLVTIVSNIYVQER